MIDGWIFVLCFIATFGLPLLAVGVILRLCEGSWGKKTGELGSVGFLALGLLLCLPLGLCFAVALLC